MRQWLTIAAMVLGVSVFFGLYMLKFEGRDLEARSHQLTRQIDADKAAIKVLMIELQYLARPQRLQELNDRFLKLAPPAAAQIVSLDGLWLAPAASVAPAGASGERLAAVAPAAGGRGR